MDLLERLTEAAGRRDCLVHLEQVPARPGVAAPWPAWVDPLLVERLVASGVTQPWRHQVEAAELAHAGQSVVVATGTASGKSLTYLIPALTAVLEGAAARDGRGFDNARPRADKGAGRRSAPRRSGAGTGPGPGRHLRR